MRISPKIKNRESRNGSEIPENMTNDGFGPGPKTDNQVFHWDPVNARFESPEGSVFLCNMLIKSDVVDSYIDNKTNPASSENEL